MCGMKFELITRKDPNKNPKCPACWGGRLKYYKKTKTWFCCKEGGGWMWCAREFKGVKE